jgi:multiple sugar transport system substrate-binding protein
MRSTRGVKWRGSGQRTRRVLGVGLAAVSLLAMSACSGGNATSSGSDLGTAAHPVTIAFSWWGDTARTKITDEAVKAFEAANPNIKVTTSSVDFTSYFDRLATSVAAHDAPDVITMGGAYPSEYAAKGVLLDLKTVSKQLNLSVLDKTTLTNGEFQGKQYGVPTGVDTFGVVANPAVFKAAGVALPNDNTWTWADFEKIATQVSANSPKGTFGAEDPTGSDMLDLYARQQSGQGLYTTGGKIAIQAKTVQDWWGMTSKMAGHGTPSASQTSTLEGESNPEQTLMGQGHAAMKFAWSNLLPAFRQASGANLVMLRAPGDPSPKSTGMWLQASQLYTINARSQHPEAAAKLISFLLSSPAAADIIGSDRGISANATIRKHLALKLDASEKVEYAYIDRISALAGPAFVIGPTGSTQTPIILTRLNDAVLFGQTKPADAATQFVAAIKAAISQS